MGPGIVVWTRRPSRPTSGHWQRTDADSLQKTRDPPETSERLRDVRGVFLADFSGMDVETLSLLR